LSIEEAAKRGRTKTVLTAIEAQRKSREALVGQRQREASSADGTLATVELSPVGTGSPARDETMTSQGEAFVGEYLLPLIAVAYVLAIIQEPFRLFGGREPSKLRPKRMVAA
jgi:hypothetical protein